jgi:hypothetical protein
LTSQPPIVWRIAAAVLWIISVACLFKAVGGGAAAEQALYNQNLTDASRLASQHQAQLADRWAAAGWLLQFATTAVLSFGIQSPRVVRRIFVSLGILIAVDGVTMLLMAVIVR